MEDASTLFGDYFDTLFDHSATIVLTATSTNIPLPGELANAGTNRIFAPGFGLGEVVRNKVLSNGAVDLNGAMDDGVVAVNWGAPWELDPNVSVATTAVGDFDLFAALFHEFKQALGFSSNFVVADGSDGFSNGLGQLGGIDFDGTWNELNRHLTDCNGSNVVNANTRTNLPVWDAAILNGGGVCYAGPNAVAANGGNEIILHGRGSHLLDAGVTDNFLMAPFRTFDVDEVRTYSAIEIGMLTDFGYNRVAAVPEPGPIALVLASLVGLAAARRRRRT